MSAQGGIFADQRHTVSSRSKLGGKAQEPSLYLLERIKSIIVTLFSKVEAKEKKRREAAPGLAAYKIRVTTVSNIVIRPTMWCPIREVQT